MTVGGFIYEESMRCAGHLVRGTIEFASPRALAVYSSCCIYIYIAEVIKHAVQCAVMFMQYTSMQVQVLNEAAPAWRRRMLYDAVSL